MSFSHPIIYASAALADNSVVLDALYDTIVGTKGKFGPTTKSTAEHKRLLTTMVWLKRCALVKTGWPEVVGVLDEIRKVNLTVALKRIDFKVAQAIRAGIAQQLAVFEMSGLGRV